MKKHRSTYFEGPICGTFPLDTFCFLRRGRSIGSEQKREGRRRESGFSWRGTNHPTKPIIKRSFFHKNEKNKELGSYGEKKPALVGQERKKREEAM